MQNYFHTALEYSATDLLTFSCKLLFIFILSAFYINLHPRSEVSPTTNDIAEAASDRPPLNYFNSPISLCLWKLNCVPSFYVWYPHVISYVL